MKNILILLILLLGLGFQSNVFAQEGGLAFGLQSTDIDVESGSPDPGIGLYVGWIGKFDMGNGGGLRTGALLSQRKFENKGSGITAKAEMLSVDVPVTYFLKPNDSVTVYGGVKLGLNVSDDCSATGGFTCDTEAESIYYGINGGASFMATPDFSVDVDLVIGLSDIADNVEWKNSVAVGVTYNYY